MEGAKKDLSIDDDYQSCVFLITNAGFAKRSKQEFRTLSQELESYGPGLSGWFEVYAANPGSGRPSPIFLRVVNAFLERWSPENTLKESEGFSYHAATTSFHISREVWEGLDAGFRRDFDAARERLGKPLNSCVSMAKILTLMMVDIERNRKVWLTGALYSKAFREAAARPRCVMRPRRVMRPGNVRCVSVTMIFDAFAGCDRGGERASRTRAPPPFLARSMRRTRRPEPGLGRGATNQAAETDSGVSTEPDKVSQVFRLSGAYEDSEESRSDWRFKRGRGQGDAAAAPKAATNKVAAARVVPETVAATAAETQSRAPDQGDPVWEVAVQHVAAMLRNGVRGLLLDGAERARDERSGEIEVEKE
ncbi:hypothetical protein KFL_000750110 [Klebsormidium nitens]|uniref:Uncharacterized protein n=1 Tax=Klebsormidium nitens TaxID=105231 RepID=A0A0U9HQT4_KLENI|nr:hypothetical protein KFL_000750110 [Klebsormidium nitens]|eukprot:GAQ81242.1 hypothetical protein KFL_000750110 [Klebsormidium nitens]